MRLLAASFVLAALATPAAAQDLEIPDAPVPTLVATAQTVQGFVPGGWTIEARAASDLNGDGLADVVLVLHGADPKLVISNEGGLGEPQLDTNPRILAVIFGKATGGYRLGVQDSTFISRRMDPVQSDPFTPEDLTVQGQSIRVRQELFMSAGGWGMFGVTYTFRWQHDRLEMIGYDRNDTQRNTGETRSVSINYSTGKVKIATGNISSDDDTVVWKALPDRRRLSIGEIGDGLDFDAGFSE